MNETGSLYEEARNAALKISKSQDVTNAELEALLKVYGSNITPRPETKRFIEAFKQIVEISLIPHLIDNLEQSKGSFTDMLIGDMLNGSLNYKTLIESPSLPLSKQINLNDEAKGILDDLLREKINEEIVSSDFSKYASLSSPDIQTILNNIESANYLAESVKSSLNLAFSSMLFGKISPELEQISKEFGDGIAEAIKNGDGSFDAKSHKSKFFDAVRNIENNSVVRGSSSEELLKKSKTSFETQFDKSVGELVSAIIEGKMVEELEVFDNELEINNYERSKSGTAHADITGLIKEILDDDLKSELEKKLKDKLEFSRISCRAKPPKVKVINDSEGNEYAVFKTEKFPVARRNQKNPIWKFEPKRLGGGKVLLTFKDATSDKKIVPSVSKQLRAENPYELTEQEWKDLDRGQKEARKLLKDIEKIREKIDNTTDDAEKAKLQEELNLCFEKIPFYVQVLNKLKMFHQVDYIQDKVPSFNPEKIKVTPDIMENLREVAECSRTQLESQTGGLIIQGEAGVGKNVLIDIFAHYTNRPVFVFACGKKTDTHDLTYLWILDENGSKKLNSKIYEAIRTPGAILVLDEINTLDAGVIKGLNGLFDGRRSLVSPEEGGSDVKALDDVLIFGTMNPVGYAGVQKLPADVSSRFHFITHDYDWMFDASGGVSYSDALRTYGNVKGFRKIAAGNGMRKQDVELYQEALLDKRVGNKLSQEKKDILNKYKPVNDSEFIWAWNQLFNGGDSQAVNDRFGGRFIEGMKDIYTIVLYSNYIRMRHKIAKENIESDNFPWDEDTNELFDEKSFSPRLVIQALEQLHNGNEIVNAKHAVIQTYIDQVSDVSIRGKIEDFFNTMSDRNIEDQLKDRSVQKVLSKKKLMF